MRKFHVLIFTILLCGVATAQSLHDVIVSLSDRQRVIQQYYQVQRHLINQTNDSEAEDQPIPAYTPFEWHAVGLNPSPSAIESLGLSDQLKLLNQAVYQFDALKYSFLNASDAELANGGTLGNIKPFENSDFDSLPRATPGNFHSLLFALSQRVRALRLISWPAAYQRKSFYHDESLTDVIDYDANLNPFVKTLDAEDNVVNSPEWFPESISASNADEDETVTTHVFHSYLSSMSVTGHYHESDSFLEEISQPLRHRNTSITAQYPTKARVCAKPTGTNDSPIDGNVWIVRRSQWHELDVANPPADYATDQAGYVVKGSAQDGEITLMTKPASAINGDWITTSAQGALVAKQFVADGYVNKGNSLLHSSNPSHSYDFQKSYELNWNIGCRFHTIFKPTFTRGVDAPALLAKLKSVDQITAPVASDGEIQFQPRADLLYGIAIGAGIHGSGNGYVAVNLNDDHFSYSGVGDFFYGQYNYYNQIRIDSTYALAFSGNHSDYHVVYDNVRSSRPTQLPDGLAWPVEQGSQTIYDTATLYYAWDSPRLRQVIGRDLIVDIQYNNKHFGGYTIRVYRRSLNAATPEPGQPIATNGLTLLRTWTASKPEPDDDTHPADSYHLAITGNQGEIYEVTSNATTPQLNLYDGFGLGLFNLEDTIWNFTVSQASAQTNGPSVAEKYKKIITIDLDNANAEEATKIQEYQDGQLIHTLTSSLYNPFSEQLPFDWKITKGDKTFSATAVFDYNFVTPFSIAHPSALTIDYNGVQPDLEILWDESGLLQSQIQGNHKIDGDISDNAHRLIQKYNNQRIGTTWSELTDGGDALRIATAPDGASYESDDEKVFSTTTHYGNATVGLPGLPHKIINSGETGASYQWNIATDDSGSVTIDQGLLSGSSVTRGTREIQQWNTRGHTTKSETYALLGSQLKTSSITASEFTAWGAPQKSTDDFTNLHSTWTFDNNLSRLASITSPLGLATTIVGYDALNRPGTTTTNGITASHTHDAFNPSTTYSGAIIGENTQTRDALGRITSQSITWNGVNNNATITHNANSTELTRNNLLGEHKQTVRNEDGTVAETSGPTMAFGGTKGNALSVANGLLVTKTEITDAPGTYQESHTDAWGRIHKIVTPQKSGNTPAETTFTYSLPGSALKRVITTESTGKITIEESDPYHTGGAISRSGIDIDGNGALGAADRYTQSITTVADGKVVTTFSITEDSGMREVLKSEWTPSSGVTVTKVNGNEETITSTPNYTNKTVTTESSKGWTRTTGVNNLGLATSNTLSGTGVPTTSLTPTWRADGSLAAINFTQGGETHTANFNPNGTLTSLTAPGRGNILAEHTISNGTETLTIDGKTTQTSLNGTSQTISGSNVIARTQSLATTNGGYQQTITPATGAATETHYNHALAQTKKKYADQSQQTITYEGELPKTSSLVRGGDVGYTFTTDGARDLSAIHWPQVESGPFEIPSFSHAYTYNRSGAVKTLTDPSGLRTFAYTNGRPSATAYSAGILKGYQILTATDTSGRHIGTELKRDGASLHTIVLAPNAASDQINALASGGLTATPQRDGAGRINGYLWSDGTNSVTQTWTRGIAGRIEFAGSNVPAAPSFDYLIDPQNPAQSFDAQNRRLKCQTSGGTWTYTYSNGQLTNATHPTLGTFTYQFDAIGRRTDKGTANTSDLLNRTIAWTNSQTKTLTLTAHPGARVWFNGTEIQNFTGTHQATLTTTNPAGEWKPWNTLAILEGAGEGAGSPPTNPLASPDAKSAKSGAVWLPPANETLTYDAAGNRQSNAQWDYGWDAKNQLIRIRTKNHTTAPHAYDLTYTYDAEGRRVQKHVLEYQNGGVVSEKIITFLWDDWDLLYERHQLPSGLTLLERKYLWGPDIADGEAGGAGGLLLITEIKGNTTTDLIPLYDGTGHIIALTDIEKNLHASYTYGPFGEKITATGPKANTNPWRWATKYLDEETGLYYFGMRYYDPLTGQWLSREPLGEEESLNLYSYCHNDPVNKVDVLGLMEVPNDMEEKRIQESLLQAARLELLDILSSKDDSWMPEAERLTRHNIRTNIFLQMEYARYDQARRDSYGVWLVPESSVPIQHTAALSTAVGAPAANANYAALGGMFINPIGAEMFALKGLGTAIGIAAKEVLIGAKAANGIQKMRLISLLGRELESGAMLVKADAAFMQTPQVRQLMSIMSPAASSSVAPVVTSPSRAQLLTPRNLLDDIVTDANRVASPGGAISAAQTQLLRQNLPVIQRRSPSQNAVMRADFVRDRSYLIKRWEEAIGIMWPQGATPHHIIPLESGGANKWWNLMPTNGTLPNHSLPGIPGPHAAGGLLRDTIQRGPRALPPGTTTDLRLLR